MFSDDLALGSDFKPFDTKGDAVKAAVVATIEATITGMNFILVAIVVGCLMGSYEGRHSIVELMVSVSSSSSTMSKRSRSTVNRIQRSG